MAQLLTKRDARFRAQVLSVEAPPGAALVDLWDVAVFVEADFDVAARRGAERNLVWLDSLEETHDRYRVRYLPAQRRYLVEHRPRERADLVFENTDPKTPTLTLRPRSGP